MTIRKASLLQAHPALSKQWHPTKNGTLNAGDVTAGSGKKVWWLCEKSNHEWEAVINSRVRGNGCAICANKLPHPSNSLAVNNPNLAHQWHPQKNGDLKPSQVTLKSAKKVWWKCLVADDHEWIATINDRSNGSGCPFCSGRRPSKTTCLGSLFPNLVIEWHPTKNAPLTPNDVTRSSNKKVWWKCPVANDHEWLMPVAARTGQNQGCPMCSGRIVVNSNCLATTRPDLAKQWHPTKNAELSPNYLTQGSHKKVWWQCSVADDHEWIMPVYARTGQNQGCPMCAGKIIVKSNCLATTRPDYSKQWHLIKNGRLTPYDVGKGSTKKVWWKCPVADDHEWENSPSSRINQNSRCPFCRNIYVTTSNCLATTNPKLTKEWHPTLNGKLTAFDVTQNSSKKVWWKCDNGVDHEWMSRIVDRKKNKCPICDGKKVVKSISLRTISPELAKQWHPTKNGNITPDDVTSKSGKRVWWKCPVADDHEWKASPSDRSGGRSCPFCINQKVTNSNCLNTTHPTLVKEWHPTKNDNLTPYDVTSGSRRKIWWVCENDNRHEWVTTAHRRTERGDGCPYCNLKPQSRQELTILFELASIFDGIDYSGYKTRIGKKILHLDIFIPSLSLVLEYDSYYWHKDKVDKDIAKTQKLLSYGYRVIRIRETPLIPIFEEDISFEKTVPIKQLIDTILTQIKERFTLDTYLQTKLDLYLSKTDLVNVPEMNSYIKSVLAKK